MPSVDLGQDLGAATTHPDISRSRLEDRHRISLPRRLTLGGRHVRGPIFHVVHLLDPLQHLIRLGARIRPRVVELPSARCPAGHLHDLAAGAQEDPVVASVGIGLEETLVAGEERRRTVAAWLIVKS